MLLLDPVFNEVLDLGNVHELHVIHVTILLGFYYDAGRDAFVAHCFGIWLVVFALFVHLVTDLLRGKAVVAFYL